MSYCLQSSLNSKELKWHNLKWFKLIPNAHILFIFNFVIVYHTTALIILLLLLLLMY